MKRITSVDKLAQEVNETKVRPRQYIKNSVSYLINHGSELSFYHDIYHLAEVAYDSTDPDNSARSIAYHLETVRSEMASRLWAMQIFVGVSVIDELLFMHIKTGATDPVRETLKSIRESEANRRGMIIFPLHSFGILAAGLLQPISGSRAMIFNTAQQFAICPQTNSLNRTVDFLSDTVSQLGIGKAIDDSLIHHWRASRDARWLEKNPLLVISAYSTSGYYYENEFLILGRIQTITTAIIMLATLQPRESDRQGFNFSSSRINNWETLDINHYLVLSHGEGEHLDGRAVPVHKRRQVAELSELSVDIDPRYWRKQSAKAQTVYDSVDQLFAGYLKYSVGSRKENSRSRTFRKVFEAVTYFRRSHQGDEESWNSIVSLATAFEMLLTDYYSPGIGERLRRRTQLLLKGVPGTRVYQAAVKNLYDARSATVHTGTVPSIDLHDAQVAFTRVFLALMPRLATLRDNQAEPLAFLTGDL